MLFIAILIVIVIPSSVFAQETQTVISYPTDDAYVDRMAGDSNFGSAPQLKVSWTYVTPAGVQTELRIDRLAYLKFNLSIPEGSIVRWAYLRLFVINAVGYSSTLMAVPAKNTTWTENTIVGKNAPDIPTSEKEGRDEAIDEVDVTNLNTWYSLNVTSYARSVLSGWLSLMVIGGRSTRSPYSDIVSFYSKESPDPALRPSLEVTYSASSEGEGAPRIVHPTSQSSQTVFYPTDDAYVDLRPSGWFKNFGSDPTLQVCFDFVQSTELPLARVAYLKFNLSLPESSIIGSASLKLYVTSAATGSSTLMAIPTKNTTWTENTIIGKNAPDIPTSDKQGRKKAIDEVKIIELNNWYSLNVTSYARSVRSGWLSLMVIGGNKESPYTTPVSLYSKESPDPGLRPSLEVTYFPSESGEPGQRLVYLTLRSSHFGGSIQFNNTEYQVPDSLEVVLDVPTGHYSIGASIAILVADNVIAVFQKWNDGASDNPRYVQVNESITVEAEYVEHYYLNVTTQCGVAGGAGWYENGTSVTARIIGDPGTNPPTVKAGGIVGLLGVSYVFDHWSGYPTRSASLQVVVDGPMTVTAIWRQDYSLLHEYLITGALSLGVGLGAAILVRKKVVGKQQRTGIERRRRLSLTLTFTRRAKPSSEPTDVVGRVDWESP
jgi:hypothetical protein